MNELNREYLDQAVASMRKQGVRFAAGLNTQQVQAVEAMHGFSFPPDLRSFLEHALPVGKRFPDWRKPGSSFIRDRLTWPADSMCFDIEHDAFWLPAWGLKPASLKAAQATARRAVSEAPPLIPIFAHRYIPAVPAKTGNPIFSVYQTDIIYYGLDLASYLLAEFRVPNPFPTPPVPREIAFWSDLERMNG